MKKDIETKEDIKIMVDRFYDAIQQDTLLGPIFNDVSKVDWPSHLPKMYLFWENAVFFTGGYNGNPLKVHQHIHELFPLTSDHFYRWNEIFIKTVNDVFEGKNAELAKTRALHISMVLQEKLARVDQLQNLFK
jgi:hemoglobin